MKLPEYKPKLQAEQYVPASQPNSYGSIIKQGCASFCTHFTLPLFFLTSFAFFALCRTLATAQILTYNYNRFTTYNY